MNFITLLVLSFLQATQVLQQETIPNYPQNYFQSPLDIPLSLAGNFGEPRKSHFHTGLDFKTNAREGLKVYAVADGYISRIGVSSAGYGNTLYITHPNGYTSVYGHLQKFNETITAMVRKEQYAKESFPVDITLKQRELVIKKGELIALSGNSGGSGGPHLHFEIRDGLERPVNPLLFGYELKDKTPPTINALQFYAMDEKKFFSTSYRIPTSGKAGAYVTSSKIILLNANRIGISINTFDKMEGTASSLGIYNLSLSDNGKEVYNYSLKRVSFPHKRYVLSQIDYPIFLKEGSKSFHKCFVEPGNYLPSYETLINRGVIDISDGKIHELKITTADFEGNKSEITLEVKYEKEALAFKEKKAIPSKILNWEKENSLMAKDVKLLLPLGCLFDSILLNFNSTVSSDPTIFSDIYTFNNSATQLFDFFQISIPFKNISTNFQDKAIVVWKDIYGSLVTKGGKFDGKFISTKTRELGTYFIKIDTTAPKISPINISNTKVLPPIKNILVSISDNLSGIDDFDAYVDGKWQLMEYDGKAALLKMNLQDKNISAGKHSFKLVVTDERKNKAVYEASFISL